MIKIKTPNGAIPIKSVPVRFHISPKRTAPPKPDELISGKCAAVTPPNAITLASIMPACRAFCRVSGV